MVENDSRDKKKTPAQQHAESAYEDIDFSVYPGLDHDPSAYMYLEHYDDFMNICCFGEGMGNKDYAEVKREWKKAGRPKRPKEVKEAQEKERIRSFVESYCHKL